MTFLDKPTRALLFTGKGGMGKTSVACATALSLARGGKRVLVVSTDPASNLDEVLQTTLGQTPTRIDSAERLFALNLDPNAAAAAYRERVIGPYRGVLPEAAVASIEEQLSGACTLEIAAFDIFAHLLADPGATSDFEHVVFDTAPTGHTLRLLALPRAWSDFLITNTTGSSCLGPLAGLEAQRALYEGAVAALSDGGRTTLVLVSRPEPSALAEAERTRAELDAIGLSNQQLVLNGVFTASSDDPVAAAVQRRQRSALDGLPPELSRLPNLVVPLQPFAPVGLQALGRLFEPSLGHDFEQADTPDVESVAEATPSLGDLIDEIAERGRGIVLTMGKGGVGKTTVAAAIATELARRGHPVHLSTTDPAAHLIETMDGDIDGLTVSRVDPGSATREYTEEVLNTAGRGLDRDGLALLQEDLRSPCTEEIAVFRAFARVVDRAEHEFVVLDTAPTGHTLLLLQAAEAYDREVARTARATPEEVRWLLPRLRDPEFATVLLVTLAEATPVHEAARLAEDLARTGVHPYAWVINQSLAPVGSADPVLARRALAELRHIDEVRRHANRLVLIPWQREQPKGKSRLGALLRAS